eukprot:Sdes_comp18824_c0_seq1m9246
MLKPERTPTFVSFNVPQTPVSEPNRGFDSTHERTPQFIGFPTPFPPLKSKSISTPPSSNAKNQPFRAIQNPRFVLPPTPVSQPKLKLPQEPQWTPSQTCTPFRNFPKSCLVKDPVLLLPHEICVKIFQAMSPK